MDKIPVFLASDDYYAPFIATTIFSILDNSKSYFNFYILDSGISQKNKNKIENLKKDFSNFSLEYIEIDIKKKFSHLYLHNKKHTLNVFSRYLIPVIKPNLDKVLYLDADIIVVGDLLELYNESLDEYHLGAIPAYSEAMYKHQEELGLSRKNQYFNAGILLIDCKYFRENNLTKILLEKTLEMRPKFQDQDILNVDFENNYKILDFKYNVTLRMHEYNEKYFNQKIQKAVENPFIIHYVLQKPWSDLSAPYVEFFWKYASRTIFLKVILSEYLGVSIEQKVEEIKEQIRKRDKRIRKKNKEIMKLKKSKSFRIGNLFFRSIKSPLKAVTFPVNFVRIFFSAKKLNDE
jgi:lipopolysaccharide biosynthesis glycosyltransferase